MVQRVEIITSKERRRRWSDEEKRRLVAEAFAPGAVVAHVARLHDVAESCLYGWRKRFGRAPGELVADQPRLIPVLVDAAPPAMPASVPEPPPPCHAVLTLPDGTRVEIEAGYPAAALRALIAALRRA